MKKAKESTKDIKCVVWDLDNTLWNGILLESNNVALKPGIAEILQTLDSRGILLSVASKGNYEDAMKKLNEFNLAEYFLYPEIHWNPKSVSVERIQKNLNIGMDTFMFVDDQPFERDEVKHSFPEVTCFDSADYMTLLDHPRLNPRFITKDSGRRRLMYMEEMKRKEIEEDFEGPKKEFLESLEMEFIIGHAVEEDLQRAEELTERTNQLNTTGQTFGYEELKEFIHSDDHMLLISELKDKYGSYGKIGLALIELNEEHWNLKLFLMSCRVMARGAGTVFLSHIMNEAKSAGRLLRADFKKTDRNRMMFVTFKFANFKVIETDENDRLTLENDLSFIQKIPPLHAGGHYVIEVPEMDIAQKLKEFIESHIVGQDENINLKLDDKIFEMGFLDSMFALQLVNFIEENFGIEVTDEDLDIQNFSSIERLVSFVNSKS